MGVGASNVSKSSLDVYQESITNIGQQLRAKASNKAKQDVNIKQTINFKVGTTDQCENDLLRQNVCEDNCNYENRGEVYKCQFSNPNKRLVSNETSSQNCDLMFGTEDDAMDSDGICNGSSPLLNLTESDRANICFNRAARLACPSNLDYTEGTCNNNCNKTTYISKTNLENNRIAYNSTHKLFVKKIKYKKH